MLIIGSWTIILPGAGHATGVSKSPIRWARRKQPYVCELVAVLIILYAGNKSHLKYRNAIAFDIAESILAYLDADDFSL